jgi:hypothetical protein
LFVFLASKAHLLPLTSEKRKEIRSRLENFAREVSRYLSTDNSTDKSGFDKNVDEYAKSIRASSDIGNRRRRHNALEDELGSIFADASSEALDIPIKPIQEGLFDSSDPEED